MAELRARLARVAEQLFGLDTDPQLSLLRGGGLRGRSAAVAADVAPLIDTLWQRYSPVKERADALADHGRVDASLEAEVASLEADLARVLAAGAELAEAWRRMLPWVDAAASSLAAALVEAARLRVEDEPLLVAAGRSLEALQDDVASDPLSADATSASAAVEQAVERVRALSERYRALPGSLDEAAVLLVRVRELVREGRERLDAARLRVVDTSGLLEPLDPSVVDGGERSLGPWLQRLRDEAVEGDVAAAAEGLQRWRVVADGVLRNAEAIVAANRAPVERRDQLRGLLDAYEAKAAAGRLAERPEIVALQRDARAALHARPADVDAGERAVVALGRAIASASAVRP